MSVFISICIWIFVGATTGYVASKRGRDPYLWFFLGILFGVFSLLLLMILPSHGEGVKREAESEGEIDDNSGETVSLVITPASQLTKESFFLVDWFYLDKEGRQQGPLAGDVLKTLWQEEKIIAATFVWSNGMPQWKRIAEIEGLSDSLNKQES